MKKVQKLLALVLAMALLAGLSGCELGNGKMEALVGRWEFTMTDSQEQAVQLLELSDFYPEEISICKGVALKSVKVVEFSADGTYAFSFDVEKTKACVRAFYAECFQLLYAQRDSLSASYETDFSAMSQEEFFQMYAQMYEQQSMDALLDLLAENAYAYEELVRYETGTFRVLGKQIRCNAEGGDEAETMGYALDGDQLTLEYIDGEEVYQRVP